MMKSFKNEKFCIKTRKQIRENRSLHTVNEDFREADDKVLRQKSHSSIWAGCAVLFGLATSHLSYASFNLVGGGSMGFNSDLVGNGTSLLAGGEVTINIVNVAELGVFYDHNFVGNSYFNFAGAVGRVGFGPLMGLFIDAKLGLSPQSGWPGFGAGLGYHFTSILGVHGGIRVLNQPAGMQTLGDLSLMLFL